MPVLLDQPPFTELIRTCKRAVTQDSTSVEHLIVSACRFVDEKRLEMGGEDYGEGFSLGRAMLQACVLVLTDVKANAVHSSKLVRLKMAVTEASYASVSTCDCIFVLAQIIIHARW
jgi:hypothetical protein